MSTKEVPDIGEMLKFWELKDRLHSFLSEIARLRIGSMSDWACDFMVEIESIGKKEES